MLMTLYKISVPVSGDAEDAAVDLLQRCFQEPACVEMDVRTHSTCVSVYLKNAPSRARLKAVLPHFSIQKLPPQNWAESWKRHFKPIEIGSKLLIKPSWSRRQAKAGQRVIVLDPGLSFGTGQHATTGFCLEQVVACRAARQRQSFLDVGTGSGILAIAAAKLGYAPVRAFDLDPAAVRIARANAMRNRVADRVRLTRQDVANYQAGRSCDLICANLLADLLLSQRDQMIGWLKPAGRLVLAGILRSEFPEIQAAYERAGLRLIARTAKNEWESGAFSRR